MYRRLAFERPVLAILVLMCLAVGPALAVDPWLVDRTAQAGIVFEHFNGMSGQLYFAEMAGSGVAVLDLENDGDLDVVAIQGGPLGDLDPARATFPPRHEPPFAHRVFRNDRDEGGNRFTDVTATAGIAPRGYPMGVATGDFDRDGFTDLYVTALGSNQLLRSNGDGSFTDLTEAAGVDDRRWSAAAVFFDFDADGWLDLWVGNYVDFRLATHKSCSTPSGATDYCGPNAFKAEGDRLFRNRGDGSFEDVTVAAGLARAAGPALGEAVADFDGNGWLDLYVANDGSPNFLWLNQGDGTFRDEALLGGCAVNAEGQPEASMGVVPGDFDGDGDVDLFMTHLDRETNTVYLNDGNGLFVDASETSGLGMASWRYTGFGTALLDVDGDGVQDLFVANGAVKLLEDQLAAGDPHPLRQRNLLFRGVGDGRFEEVAGLEALDPAEVSRGVTAADLDDDGDVDLLVTNNAGPLRWLENRSPATAWLGLRLVADADGGGSSTVIDQPGARVELVSAGDRSRYGLAHTDGSYASARDGRVLFRGLEGLELTEIRVTWPDGTPETFDVPPLGAYSSLRRGAGRPSS